MRHIFLIIFAIIFFIIGSNLVVSAKMGYIKNDNIILAEHTINIDDYRNNSSDITEGKISARKQNTSKLKRSNNYYLEDAENQSSSFQLNLFLIMVTLIVFLAIMNVYGNKGNVRDYQQFD